MNLGELITALSAYPENAQLSIEGPGRCAPVMVDSYRGYYEDLAISYTPGTQQTVGAFLSKLRSAVGEVFHGYKGGEYRMTESTKMWVSQYGTAEACQVDGVYVDDDRAVYIAVRMQWRK